MHDTGMRESTYEILYTDEKQTFFFNDDAPEIDDGSVVWETPTEVSGPATLNKLSFIAYFPGEPGSPNYPLAFYWRLTIDDEVYSYRFRCNSSSQKQANINISTDNAISDVSASGLQSDGYIDTQVTTAITLKLNKAVFANHIKLEVAVGRQTGYGSSTTTILGSTVKYQLLD